MKGKSIEIEIGMEEETYDVTESDETVPMSDEDETNKEMDKDMESKKEKLAFIELLSGAEKLLSELK